MQQRNASPLTIANYRDTFRLLIAFAHRRLKRLPTALTIHALDAPFVCRFLDYLEQERGNSPRSRNVRLAAIRSFFSYVALREPALGAVAQRVLAIKGKRDVKTPVDYLTRAEAEALVAAPDQGTWAGRRDRTLLLLTLQTGLRVSEVVGLRCQDLVLGTGAHVRCTGKGRKTRCVPLRKEVVAALRLWLREQNAQPVAALFPSARGVPMSRDGVEYLLAKHVAVARLTSCATPPPWTCCNMEWTGPSSPYGWDMNPWSRPRSIFTQVSNLKNAPSPKWNPSRASRVAIVRPTKFWPFYKTFNYAERDP
jgi:site-specific recombinase XerD